jgi:hypothetical protein
MATPEELTQITGIIKAKKGASCCTPCRNCDFLKPCNAKEWHQGIIMSGPGAPPGTVLNKTNDKNFLYQYWYDWSHDILYVLQRSMDSIPLRYLAYEHGQEIMSGFFQVNNFTNEEALINARGFVFGPPPVPLVLGNLIPNNRYPLNPDVWLSSKDYDFTVFVRDQRNGRFYRDSFNDVSTLPEFMLNKDVCNGDIGLDNASYTNRNLKYIFDGNFCRWYLDGFINEEAAGLPLGNSKCDLDAINASQDPNDSNGPGLPYPPFVRLCPDPTTLSAACCAKLACPCQGK